MVSQRQVLDINIVCAAVLLKFLQSNLGSAESLVIWHCQELLPQCLNALGTKTVLVVFAIVRKPRALKNVSPIKLKAIFSG